MKDELLSQSLGKYGPQRHSDRRAGLLRKFLNDGSDSFASTHARVLALLVTVQT